MDVGGSNTAFGTTVSSLGPLGGLATDGGVSSLATGEDGQGSGELLENGKHAKARKPYTISKARERWSEEEHQRFVEAVRLHGRAWRKIEEHIGTKTAVQIRSHAQKFFNKLEKKKESGQLPDKDEDIAIPPPRPKRKPSKPYPRKDGFSSSGLTGTSQLQASTSQLPANSQLPPGLQSALQHHLFLQQQQPQQSQQQGSLLFQQQHPAQHQQPPYGLPHSLGMGVEGLLHNFDSLTTASSLASGHQLLQAQQQQQPQNGGEVTDATVAAVTAAASAAAAAAAAAVVAAAGQEVQMHMQAHPPSCFPFFGVPPSAFAQLAPAAPALDQAVHAAEQAAAATAAAYRFGGSAAAAAAADAAAAAPAMAAANAAAAEAAANDEHMGVEEEAAAGGDKGLLEATGTTDGTHISANAQPRGSDGDSACSRETDNQDPDADVNMDVTWQGKLHEQQQHSLQHGLGSGGNPAAAAARSLSGGAFDPSALQWGLGAAGLGLSAPPEAAAAAASQMLSALGPAQVLALLSNPLYLAAANQHFSQQAQLAAAGNAHGSAGRVNNPNHHHSAAAVGAAGRSGGGAGGAAGNTTRSKSRRTAPSVNSGSTGPPVGTKRGHDAGSDEAAPAAKKAAHEVSDANDGSPDECMEGLEGTGGMQVSPSSPSIQEKQLKAASQPSNTNGNTSGSNESDGSKRRQGTTQGEGSNPTSVKDSNTATQTNGCSGNGSGNGNGHTNGNGTNGNGTSAFHPLGHHHHHGHTHTHQHQHNGQPDSSRSSRPKAQSSSAPAAAAGAKAPGGHHHHQHPATTGAEGSNGNGNGMSGTNNGMSGTNNNTSGTNDASGRDEGRSSSDLEGPTQAQVLQRHQLQQEQQAAEEDTAGGQLQQQQVVGQDGTPAAQLQALLANLHGMCGASPLMQAYGAAAAAQQMLASALQHLPNGATATAGPDVQQHAGSQLLAALQQQLAQGGTNMGQMQPQAHPHPPGSQGFAPWHADGTQAPATAFNTAAGLHALSQHQGGATPADAAASAQLAAAAAGLMGLGGGGSSWGAGTAASPSMSARVAGVNLPLTQQFQRRPLDAASVAAAAAAASTAVNAGAYPGMLTSSGAAAIAAAAAAQQQLQQTGFGVNAAQHGAFGSMSAAVTAAAALGGFGEVSGLELLSRAAQSAGALVAGEGCVGTPAGGPAAGAGCRQVRASRSSDHSAPRARKPTQTL